LPPHISQALLGHHGKELFTRLKININAVMLIVTKFEYAITIMAAVN